MKRRKQRIALALAMSAVMAGSMLAGCGSGAGQTSGASAEATGQTEAAGTTAEAPAGEEVTIELVCGDSVTIPDDADNFLKQELKEKLGINVKFTILGAGADYATALNTRITGGDVPDLFKVPSRDAMYQYADNGAILDLTPYKDQLADVIEWTGGEDALTADIYKDGLYLIPRRQEKLSTSWYLRKDWLDKVGGEIPTTLDEVLELAKKFTFEDPDGNGKDDTYGYSCNGLRGFQFIMNNYDTSAANQFVIRDGEVTSTLYGEHVKQALEMCKKFVDAGVVDPDIIANNGDAFRDKVIQGKVGIVTAAWGDFLKQTYVDQMKEVDPNVEWICFETPAGDAGDEARLDDFDVSNTAGNWVVSADVAKDDAKLQKVIELLNFIVSEDGTRLFSYGLEGRHYNVEDGVIVKTDLMTDECSWLWPFQICYRDDSEYMKTKFPECAEYIDFTQNEKRMENYNTAVNTPEGYHKEDLDKYISDNMIKFIYGQRSIDEYDQFLSELDNSFQFQSYLESAKTQIAEKGFLK